MIGRRVATMDDIERPGDYCGPIEEVGSDGQHVGRAVWCQPYWHGYLDEGHSWRTV